MNTPKHTNTHTQRTMQLRKHIRSRSRTTHEQKTHGHHTTTDNTQKEYQ